MINESSSDLIKDRLSGEELEAFGRGCALLTEGSSLYSSKMSGAR